MNTPLRRAAAALISALAAAQCLLPPVQAAPQTAHSNWIPVEQVDKWGDSTGEVVFTTPATPPLSTPDFPWDDLRAQLIVSDCDDWGLLFSQPVVLADGKRLGRGSDSYASSIETRLDRDKDFKVQMHRSGLSSKTLFAWTYVLPTLGRHPKLTTWSGADTVTLLIPLHGQSPVAWEFELSGLDDVLSKVCTGK